jgi:hypothetical protein
MALERLSLYSFAVLGSLVPCVTFICHQFVITNESQKTGRMMWLPSTCDIPMKWKAVGDNMVSFKSREIGLSNDTSFV